MFKLLIALCTLSTSLLASNVGVSSLPLHEYKNMFSLEYNQQLSGSTNPGMQVQYLYSATKKIGFDAALRISKNDYLGFVAGATYEVLPDYNKQPRFSLRAFYERENWDGADFNNFGISPTTSKGFNFNSIHLYPFAAAPTKISIYEDSDDVRLASSLAFGVNGKIPNSRYQNIQAHIEANINLKNTISNLSLGASIKF